MPTREFWICRCHHFKLANLGHEFGIRVKIYSDPIIDGAGEKTFLAAHSTLQRDNHADTLPGGCKNPDRAALTLRRQLPLEVPWLQIPGG